MAFTTLSDDEFYYGRRQLIDYDRTAQPTYAYEPLSPADFLDPQQHDTFQHGPRHAADVQRLYAIFRQHYRVNPLVTVLTGVKLQWGIPGLAEPAPDVAVLPNGSGIDAQQPVLDLAAAETRPSLVVEVTSPRFADADLDEKVQIYAAAGVQEYFIIDSGERETTAASGAQPPAQRVLGYQLQADGRYQSIAPDKAGRLYSAVARLWFAPAADGSQIKLFSKRTGAEIPPDPNSMTTPAAARAEATFRATSIASQLDFLRGE